MPTRILQVDKLTEIRFTNPTFDDLWRQNAALATKKTDAFSNTQEGFLLSRKFTHREATNHQYAPTTPSVTSLHFAAIEVLHGRKLSRRWIGTNARESRRDKSYQPRGATLFIGQNLLTIYHNVIQKILHFRRTSSIFALRETRPASHYTYVKYSS